jgi:hypothetical protein
MKTVDQWHASPRRDAMATSDADTGEVRVPLFLYALDRHQGDVVLVLSRKEADQLFVTPARFIAPQDASSSQSPVAP